MSAPPDETEPLDIAIECNNDQHGKVIEITPQAKLHKKGAFIRRRPPRGKRDGFIRHISERENGSWMKIFCVRGSRKVPKPN